MNDRASDYAVQKLEALRKSLVIETDPSVRFKIEKDIERIERLVACGSPIEVASESAGESLAEFRGSVHRYVSVLGQKTWAGCELLLDVLLLEVVRDLRSYLGARSGERPTETRSTTSLTLQQRRWIGVVFWGTCLFSVCICGFVGTPRTTKALTEAVAQQRAAAVADAVIEAGMAYKQHVVDRALVGIPEESWHEKVSKDKVYDNWLFTIVDNTSPAAHSPRNLKLLVPFSFTKEYAEVLAKSEGLKIEFYSKYPFTESAAGNLKSNGNRLKKEQFDALLNDEKEEFWEPSYSLNGVKYGRYVKLIRMSKEACLVCHNKLSKSSSHPELGHWEGYEWKLGEERGWIEVLVPNASIAVNSK